MKTRIITSVGCLFFVIQTLSSQFRNHDLSGIWQFSKSNAFVVLYPSNQDYKIAYYDMYQRTVGNTIGSCRQISSNTFEVYGLKTRNNGKQKNVTIKVRFNGRDRIKAKSKLLNVIVFGPPGMVLRDRSFNMEIFQKLDPQEALAITQSQISSGHHTISQNQYNSIKGPVNSYQPVHSPSLNSQHTKPTISYPSPSNANQINSFQNSSQFQNTYSVNDYGHWQTSQIPGSASTQSMPSINPMNQTFSYAQPESARQSDHMVNPVLTPSRQHMAPNYQPQIAPSDQVYQQPIPSNYQENTNSNQTTLYQPNQYNHPQQTPQTFQDPYQPQTRKKTGQKILNGIGKAINLAGEIGVPGLKQANAIVGILKKDKKE